MPPGEKVSLCRQHSVDEADKGRAQKDFIGIVPVKQKSKLFFHTSNKEISD